MSLCMLCGDAAVPRGYAFGTQPRIYTAWATHVGGWWEKEDLALCGRCIHFRWRDAKKLESDDYWIGDVYMNWDC